MFKSKGNLYILFPVVILIWGAIIYKVVAAFEDDALVLPEIPFEPTIVSEGPVKDTFSLLKVDKDPFLGHSYKKPVIRKSIGENIKKEIVWPDIQYLGIITGEGTAATVYILQLNGKQLLLESNGTVEGLSLLRGWPDRIKLKYRGGTKFFLKSE